MIKPFCFLSHCKMSCDSPCCASLCGGDSHCNFKRDAHEYIRDSDEDTDGIFYTSDIPRYLELFVIVRISFASVVQVVVLEIMAYVPVTFW